MRAGRARWGLVVGVLGAVAPHPSLWAQALRAAFRLAERGWWRTWPPLPVPPAGYWAFRMETAYGGEAGRPEEGPGGAPEGALGCPEPHDVVGFLRWCREMPAVGR